MPTSYPACGAECPRHEGMACSISGIGNLGAILGGGKGPLMFDPKKRRHRHNHMMGLSKVYPGLPSGYLLTHTWGQGEHAFAFGKHTARGITEAQYDALVERRTDPVAFDRWLWYREANGYRRLNGKDPMPLPRDLEGFVPPPEVE